MKNTCLLNALVTMLHAWGLADILQTTSPCLLAAFKGGAMATADLMAPNLRPIGGFEGGPPQPWSRLRMPSTTVSAHPHTA